MGNSCQNPPQFEVRLSGLTIYLEEFLQVMWAVPVPIYQRPVRVHCSPSPVKFRAPISACPVAFLHPNPGRFSGKKGEDTTGKSLFTLVNKIFAFPFAEAVECVQVGFVLKDFVRETEPSDGSFILCHI